MIVAASVHCRAVEGALRIGDQGTLGVGPVWLAFETVEHGFSRSRRFEIGSGDNSSACEESRQ
jgi:hypothetical protein